MTANPSRALHIWQIPNRRDGDVRLLSPSPGKRSLRIVWREDGTQRERTCADLDRAMEIGLAQAQFLAGVSGSIGPHAPFGQALAYHLDHDARGVEWSVKYERRLRELVRRWFDDRLLALPCLAFEPPDGRVVVKGILDRLDVAGYPRGTHEFQQMGALLSGVFTSGIEAGFFSGSPMTGVKYSIATVHGKRGSRFGNVLAVPEEDSPPTHRVDEHIAAAPLLTGRWFEGLPAAVMAYGGLRIEEALALEPEQVLDHTPGLIVDRQLLELRTSDNRGKAGIVLTDPKGGRSREAFLNPDIWELVRRRAEEVLAAPHRRGEPRPLFPAPRGGWQRTSNYRVRIFIPCAEQANWPKLQTADEGHRTWQWTPHSLRHHYANWLLKDLALPPTVVAGYMGHTSADVTEQMYLHRERSDINRGLTAFLARSNHV